MKEGRIYLISDEPVAEDRFPNKPFEKTANAILNLVSSNEGGKAISLEGSWGSGKSSVVRILQNIISGKKINNVKLFIFDAWSHEGDPLRRVFLERLIKFLFESGWLKKDSVEGLEKVLGLGGKSSSKTTWDDVLNWLRGNLAERNIARKVSFTRASITIAFFIVFSTILSSLGSFLSGTEGKIFTFLRYGGIAVIIAFIFIIIPIFVSAWIKKVALISTETIEKLKERILQTAEPTSVEFEAIFNTALEKALSSDSSRRLVIVIDNLDRVVIQDALKIWSTMRTFFEPSNRESENGWQKRFWLLVPFDVTGLKKLWGKLTDNKQKQQSDELYRYFLEKTFQVRFHVPQAILTEWKDYFIRVIQQVIMDCPKGLRERIYHIYDMAREPSNKPPTPRAIKQFANMLGSLCLQKGGLAFNAEKAFTKDGIPLEAVAFFACARLSIPYGSWDDIEEKMESWKNGLQNFIGKDYKKYIAALFYGVEPNVAAQILIGGFLDGAVRRGEFDKQELENYMKIEGFEVVLEKFIRSKFVDDPPAEKGRASRLINCTKLLLAVEGINNKKVGKSWNLIAGSDYIESMVNLDLFKPWDDTCEAVLTVAGKVNDVNRRKDILNHIKLVLTRTFPVLPSEDSPQNSTARAKELKKWVKALILLVKKLVEYGFKDILSDFRVPGEANQYIEAIVKAEEVLESE